MIAYNNIFPTKCAITLTCGSLVLTDDELNDFRCYRSLCSSSVLAYGSCESDYIVFSCEPQTENLVGKEFTLTLTPEGQSAILMGSYKVTECTKDASNAEWTCKAYDKMYEILNTDVSSWLSGLTYPITLADYKASLATFLGVSVTPRSALPNDSFIITKAQISGTMSAGYVLRNICELNACFGHIGRQGWLSYITLGTSSVLDVDNDTYYDFEAAEANTTAISKVIVRENSGDAGAISGTGDEIYTITGNYLIYGTDAATRQTVADNIYNAIKNVTYRPAEMEMYLDPRLELGDMITAEDMDENVHTTYVLMHDFEGIVFQDSTISARGDEHRVVEVNSVYSQVEQLASRTARLDVSVEGIEAEVSEKVDIEGGTSTTSASWSLKPEAFTVSSNGTQVLKVDSNGLEVNGKGTFSGTVSGGSINIGNGNFTVDSTGHVVMKSATVTGYATSANLREVNTLATDAWVGQNDANNAIASIVVGNTEIDGKGIKTGTVSCDVLDGGVINGQTITGGTITGTEIYSGGMYLIHGDSGAEVTTTALKAAGDGNDTALFIGGESQSNCIKDITIQGSGYVEVYGNEIAIMTNNVKIGHDSTVTSNIYIGNDGAETDIEGETVEVVADSFTWNDTTVSTKDDIASIKYLGWDVPTEMSVKNYVDDSGVFHQRVGRVDLGSLSWTGSSALSTFYSEKISKIKAVRGIDGYCNKYNNAGYVSLTAVPNGKYVIAENERVYICDTSYSDSTSFRKSLSGTYLYYELATEVTYSDGSETILNQKIYTKQITSVDVTVAWGNSYISNIIEIPIVDSGNPKAVFVNFMRTDGGSVMIFTDMVYSTKIQVYLLRPTSTTVSGTITAMCIY